MAIKKKVSVSLGALQENLEASSRELKAAQAAYQKAADRLQDAQEGHEAARTAINQGMATLKAETYVVDMRSR